MPATNSLVPVTNHHPIDIESQQTIQTSPHRYNKAVTFAKLGAIAGVCAATAGLMLADLAKMHNITLPVQHTPGRELLQGMPVNGTCPQGQIVFNKEYEMKKATILMAIFAGACPGAIILAGIGAALFGQHEAGVAVAGTVAGVGASGIVFGMPASIILLKRAQAGGDGTCQDEIKYGGASGY